MVLAPQQVVEPTDDARTLEDVLDYLSPETPDSLVERVRAMHHRVADTWISTGQAARLLGVSSRNTVKNWLQGGCFPSAYQTAGGHWRFRREEVLAVRQAVQNIPRGPVALGELELPELEEDDQIAGLD